MALAPGDVVREHLAGRVVQRYQPGTNEFCDTHGQQCRIEIDILNFEIACLAQAETRNAQQTKQAVIEPRPQCSPFEAVWDLASSLQQVLDLLVRVQMRSGPLGLERQQSRRQDLVRGSAALW